ncbi:hypothetical protein ACDN41_12035 [Priestia aryabhattai]|uniref:hypothetical protein n=1 Tax=Priestia aryabhattai TaxID=412384 RepID=UPI00353260D2
MTAEQVIKLGKEIKKPDLGWFSQFTGETWLTIGICLTLSVLLFIWAANCIIGDGEKRFIVGVILLIVAGFTFFGAGLSSVSKENEIYDQRISNWKERYAKPYIESLPKEKKEIVYIKIDAELSHETEGSYIWGNGYTYSKEVKMTPLTISFKGNGLETETNWYSTNMELTNEQKPYLEYQYLNQNLGYDINKGRYNKEIYLPESYEFTDIK